MTPSQHWTQLVNLTMLQRRCGLSEAWRITASAHPAAAMLMSAFGRTRASVSFFNSRLPSEFAPGEAATGKPILKTVSVFRGRSDLSANAGRITAEFANAKDGPAPVGGPQLKAMFRLPGNCSQKEFEAAWQGNGNTIAPINPGKIFSGLVEYIQKQKSLDYEAAIVAAKTAYPNLWDLVERIAAEKI
jgi:hypothetical protein